MRIRVPHVRLLRVWRRTPNLEKMLVRRGGTVRADAGRRVRQGGGWSREVLRGGVEPKLYRLDRVLGCPARIRGTMVRELIGNEAGLAVVACARSGPGDRRHPRHSRKPELREVRRVEEGSVVHGSMRDGLRMLVP